MAIGKAEHAAAAAQGFGRLPIVRQLALLVGLATSVAVGVAVVQWSQTPNYQLLYSSLADKDAAAVIDALQKENIPYKVEEQSGAVMVPAGKVHNARLRLATQGLPKGVGVGFEIIEKDQGFGTSQFMEAARYQRALEGELARSITTLDNVQSARVHLAIPKQSVFVRQRQKPSASVVVRLYPGRNLDGEQSTGIVHLVASSIPNLAPERVTVIDQKGRLLNSRESSPDFALSKSQFEYTRRFEESYVRRIEEILTPIIGVGRVRAQVVADLDFTVKEQTQESFNSDKPALRSEQTTEEKRVGYAGPVGIPGALSNQPPGVASVPEQATTAATTVAETDTTGAIATNPPASASPVETPSSNSRRATRNYELDKTISHTRQATGTVRRLSVAVVVDDKEAEDEDGELVRQPHSAEELTRLTTLVKETVGFTESRGDSVSIINASFITPEAVEPLPEPPWWEQPWLWDVLKQALGGVVVLLLVFGVLRPVLRSLAEKGKEPSVVFSGAQGEQLPGGQEQMSLGAPAPPRQQADYETDLTTTKTLVSQDPKRVAQVIKTWVGSDAG